MRRPDAVWRCPPDVLSLPDDQVHVWRTCLDVSPASAARIWATLSPEERERAARPHSPLYRARLIAARGLLRSILGRYLDMDPARVPFCYGPQGKPALALPVELAFNLSHTGELALVAVARGRRVGIDVERFRASLDPGWLAARILTPREQAALSALPDEAQPLALLNAWARKEAYSKARGEGLALAPNRFEVSLRPGQPAALMHTAFDPDEAARWALCELFPGPGYVSALAAEGHGWNVACWQWPDHP